MTEKLFLENSYLKNAPGQVTGITADGGIILDQSIFYATGGGQPGDTGQIVCAGHTIKIINTLKERKAGDAAIVHIPEPGTIVPNVGAKIEQHLDWERRFNHMRMHSALHLLSVVIPLAVTGGQISDIKGRLDFDMPDVLEDKSAVEEALNAFISRDLEISQDWMSSAELAANPQLVKTMAVKPPMDAGRVRLIRIGDKNEQVDLQPCGGTHVQRTSEIGAMRIGKVEKKSRLNRRVNIHFLN